MRLARRPVEKITVLELGMHINTAAAHIATLTVFPQRRGHTASTCILTSSQPCSSMTRTLFESHASLYIVLAAAAMNALWRRFWVELRAKPHVAHASRVLCRSSMMMSPSTRSSFSHGCVMRSVRLFTRLDCMLASYSLSVRCWYLSSSVPMSIMHVYVRSRI